MSGTGKSDGEIALEAEQEIRKRFCNAVSEAGQNSVVYPTFEEIQSLILSALREARQHDSGNVEVNKRSFELLIKERNDLNELIKSVRRAIASVCPADDNIEERSTLDALNVLILHMKKPREEIS